MLPTSDSVATNRRVLAVGKENFQENSVINLRRNMKGRPRSTTNNLSGATKQHKSNDTGKLDLRKQQQEKLTQMSLRIQKLEQAISELRHSESPCSSVYSQKLTGENDIRLETPSSSDNELKANSLNYFLLTEEDMQDDTFHYSISHLQNNRLMEFDGQTDISKDSTKASEEAILLLQTNGESQLEKKEDLSSLFPPHIYLRNLQFPCPPEGQGPPDMDSYIELLPSYERAIVLLDNYLHYFSWSALIITIEDLHSLMRFFYPSKAKVAHVDLLDSRKLSLLFLVFLFGSMFDLELDPKTAFRQIEFFHIMARASLAAYPVAVNTTAETIQSLILMILFYRITPRGTTAMERWIQSGSLLKLIQGIGLDRNTREYVADPEKCSHFEQLFWEYNVTDIWQSLALGRPPTVPPATNTPNVPRDVKPLTPFNPQYYIWRYEFSRLLAQFTTLGIERFAAYNDVIAYEKQIRDFQVPVSLEWHNTQLNNELAGSVLQRFLTAVSKQLAILYLHRPYFWHATSKNCSPRNALLLSHSVAIAYDSASTIITYTLDVWRMYPILVERMAPVWEPCQAAALLLGVFVIRNPKGPFAKTAFRKMEDACDMISSFKGDFISKGEVQSLMTLRGKMQDSFKGSDSEANNQ